MGIPTTVHLKTTYFFLDRYGGLWPLDEATIRRNPDGTYAQVVDGEITGEYRSNEIIHARLVPIDETGAED